MTETHEQRVERLARAMWRADGIRDLGREPEGPWAQISDVWRDEYRDFARAIIASDREAGYVTVPREPTEAMVQAHIAECAGDADEADEARVRDCWAAMIEAANSQGILDNSAAIAAHEQEERQDAP